MVLNRQRKLKLKLRPLAEFLDQTLQVLKINETEVSVAFVSEREIAKWNQQFRRKQGPTDVLSFPAIPQRAKKARPGSASAFLGDIAIAPETARRYARKNGRTLDDELRTLILHGVLHLMGYDHESDHGQMNRIEQRLRRRLGIA